MVHNTLLRTKFALKLILAAAASSWVFAAEAPAAEIIIAQSADATSLDPAFRADGITGNVVSHIFDSLLDRKADMTFKFSLAEQVEQNSPTEWTLKLRHGVKFSNGEDFNADSLKFTIERAKNPDLKAPTRAWWLPFKTVTAIDDYTVKIATDGPDPLFRARLTLLAPVPPKYLREVGDAVFARKPVGTGQYRLSDWRRDEAAVLEPNPTYWGEKAKFSRVTFRVIPEELARIAALQTGEADIVTNVSPTQAQALEGSRDARVERVVSTRVATIQFDNAAAPADTQNFREAVAYAINRDEIIKGLLRGYAAPVSSILSAGVPEWPSTKDYTRRYDPQKAAALVKELGLGNQEILLRTPSARYPSDRETALAVGAQLQKVGLNVKVRPDEWGRFFEDLKSHKVSPVYLMGQGNIWFDPYPQIEAFQKSDGFLSTWKDPEVDALLLHSNEVPLAQRPEVFGRILERMNATVAAVPLYAQLILYGVRNDVTWKARSDEQVLASEMSKTGK
jgi:peptide/nickel transport system substrate-binding protein